mmetsp:Transcript_44548/g.137250  ORF Transcript_44548/g.137250 Transcript_44548/m.137250 type:complete len:331 (-) Transcript_44548:84-1076(-)
MAPPDRGLRLRAEVREAAEGDAAEDPAEVRAPRVSTPSQQLQQQGGVGAEGGHCSAVGVQLHLHVPVVPREPASDELVVSRLQGHASPRLAQKEGLEDRVGHDVVTVGGGAAGEALAAAVEGLARGDVYEALCEAHVGEDLPRCLGAVLPERTHGLRRAHAADVSTLERLEQPAEHARRPSHVVVHKDNHSGRGLARLDAGHHLVALARPRVCLEHPNAAHEAAVRVGGERLAHRALDLVGLVDRGDDENRGWAAGHPRIERELQGRQAWREHRANKRRVRGQVGCMLAGMLWRVWPVAEGEQELDGPAGELDGGDNAEGEEVIWAELWV